jgi:XTP/dITP diphosphohydrolase
VRLYCATSNPGKLREFIQIVGGVQPLDGIADIPVPDETGGTFEENASAKAVYYSRYCDGPLFVDDSGLEVDALSGAPGIYSARFAGPDATDGANNRLVLEKMRGQTNRAARFVCVVALAQRGAWIGTFRGEVEGELLDEQRGGNGFGYDPLFYYPPFGCSFGEVGAERKMEVSHRARALRAMRVYWVELSAPSVSRSP